MSKKSLGAVVWFQLLDTGVLLPDVIKAILRIVLLVPYTLEIIDNILWIGQLSFFVPWNISGVCGININKVKDHPSTSLSGALLIKLNLRTNVHISK